MAVTLEAARFTPVDDVSRGAQIRERRERLGIGIKPFAERVGVDRGWLARVEKGEAENVRESSYAQVERALSDLEQEMGVVAEPSAPEPGTQMVTFRLSGNFGVDVVVRGPVSDVDALEASVARLLREMRNVDRED